MEISTTPLPPELAALEQALAAAADDAQRVAGGLSEERAAWRPSPSAWNVAECIDHLAVANRVYLQAMQPAAEAALAHGRRRRGPALPGVIGGWFVRMMEPPAAARSKVKAPSKITPRPSPPLGDALTHFLASHEDVQHFIRRYAGIDLAGVRFPNPFVRGVRFSLATGLHVIAAHERRHLVQAWRVRQASEAAAGQPSTTPGSTGTRVAS
jgi:hypothetical protein